MLLLLVDPDISRKKLRREVARWKSNSVREERGWLLLSYDDEQLSVEVAFLAKVSISAGVAPLPVVTCAVRVSYDNYDLWAPSLTFIDVFTRKPTQPPVRAYQSTTTGPRDVLIDAHPTTLQPFLCLPGIREYHTHPQHTGDEWLLHRDLGEGSISTICERIWHYMVRNVVGLTVHVQALPGWPLQAQLNISLGQGESDKMFVQAASPQGADEPALSAELQENTGHESDQLASPVT